MKIIVDNFTKIISKQVVLDKINIELTSGHIYGFQGKNGCGKTMLMRAISGLIHPSSGQVIIDNKVLGKDISFPGNMGLLIENPGFINSYSGPKNLKILSAIRKKINTNDIINTFNLVNLEYDEKKKYKKYSLGMKQKLGIAAAIMENPDLIILDEPFNALDETSCIIISDLLLSLKNKNKLIIISCHDKEELLNLSDKIFFIENGTISKTLDVLGAENND